MLWPIVALVASASPPSPPPDPALESLIRCLRSREPRTVDTHDAVATPPGLHDDQVKATSIANAAEPAFRYEGTRPHVLSCGIALYGKIPGAVRREIRTAVSSVPGWRAFRPAPAPTAIHTRVTGWGLPPNPTMYGAILLERRPTPSAPTVEVFRYAVLIP